MEGATGIAAMRLRYLVLIKFKDEVTTDEIGRIIDSWANLQNHIKQIKAFYSAKVTRAEPDQRFTDIVEMHFETENDVAQYLANPYYVDFNNKTFKPRYQEIRVVGYRPNR